VRRQLRTTAAWAVWLLQMLWRAEAAFGQQDVDLSSLTNDLKIRLWNTAFDLRASTGYKDNVELTDTNRMGSPFWSAGGDFILFRLPTGPWKLNFFVSADNRQYFGDGVSQSEQVIIAAGEAIRALPRDWSMGFGLNYSFQNQILDVSATESNRFPITRVLGDNFMGRWFARKDFKPLWLELNMAGGREILASPLDSFWQFSPRLTLGRSLGAESALSLSYQWSYEAFDSRNQVTAEGDPIAGTSLDFVSQTAELAWRELWDEAKHWRTSVTLGYDVNEDNGSGYFNFSQYRLATRAEYRGKTWSVAGYALCGYYGYPVQTIGPPSTENRRKTWLQTGVHAEKQVWKHLRVFADYAFEQSDSNVTSDLYYDTTVSIGLDLKL
jgi:hypothetical protein